MSSVASEVTKLSPSAEIELFELDVTELGGAVHHFHNGRNGLLQPVVWRSVTYTCWPIQASGFEMKSDGPMPRPRLRIGNVDGMIGVLVRQYRKLKGAKLIRRRTLVRYLDEVNFPARRNLLNHTEGALGGTVRGTTVATSGVDDPKGGTAANTLSELDATVTGDWYMSVSGLVSGNRYEPSLWLRRVSAAGLLRLGNTEGPAHGAWNIDLAMLPPTWVRITRSHPAVQVVAEFEANAGVCGFELHRQVGATRLAVSIYGIQLEAGEATTDYQAVPGATFERNPDADPDAGHPDDLWKVDQMTGNDYTFVEWELASPMSLESRTLPHVPVQGATCLVRYRSGRCGYAGGPVATIDDEPTSDADLDECSLSIAGCKLRFGANAELPIFIQPAVGLVRQV